MKAVRLETWFCWIDQVDLAEAEANTILDLMDLDRDGAVSVDDFMVRNDFSCFSSNGPKLHNPFVLTTKFDLITLKFLLFLCTDPPRLLS